jgi:hypothetical protein
MDGVSPVFVLYRKHFPVSVNDILRVLLKQVEHSNIELFVSFDTVSIMEDLTTKMAMLNIHIFESEFVFVSYQLII